MGDVDEGCDSVGDDGFGDVDVFTLDRGQAIRDVVQADANHLVCFEIVDFNIGNQRKIHNDQWAVGASGGYGRADLICGQDRLTTASARNNEVHVGKLVINGVGDNWAGTVTFTKRFGAPRR